MSEEEKLLREHVGRMLGYIGTLDHDTQLAVAVIMAEAVLRYHGRQCQVGALQKIVEGLGWEGTTGWDEWQPQTETRPEFLN